MAKHIAKGSADTARYFLRIAWCVAKILLKVLPPSLEVFLHRQFGDRYFARIAGSFLLFQFYCLIVSSVPEISASRSEQFFLGLYSLSFFGFCLFHVIDLFVRRHRVGGAIYSQSAGTPFAVWQRLNLSAALVQRYVEPFLCLSVALLLQPFAKMIAFWITTSALALFVKVHLEWWTIRCRVLDAIDARIQGQQLHANVQRRIAPRLGALGRFFQVLPGRRPGGGRRHP